MSIDAARVVLYSRVGCHLCEDARIVVAEVCERAGEQWVEVDVDTNPAWAVEHGEFVPVVTVDGVRRGIYTVEPARLERALRRRRPDDDRGVGQ